MAKQRSHTEWKEIEHKVKAGVSYRQISKEHGGLSISAITWHMQNKDRPRKKRGRKLSDKKTEQLKMDAMVRNLMESNPLSVTSPPADSKKLNSEKKTEQATFDENHFNKLFSDGKYFEAGVYAIRHDEIDKCKMCEEACRKQKITEQTI